MGLLSGFRRFLSSVMSSFSRSSIEDTALAEQVSKHLLFCRHCGDRSLTASVFLGDTRACPSMLGRIVVTKLQHGKFTDRVEHELVIAQVVCLNDAKKPIDYSVVTLERTIRNKDQPVDKPDKDDESDEDANASANANANDEPTRPKTAADIGAKVLTSSSSSLSFGEDSAADTLRTYHRQTLPLPTGKRQLVILSEMRFPIDGDRVFLVEELATMAEVISTSAPKYNFSSTMCYWYAGSLLEMASLEKEDMFTLEKFENTKGLKAGRLGGVVRSFVPEPSQQVPALRVEYAKSWKKYKEEILAAKQREDSAEEDKKTKEREREEREEQFKQRGEALMEAEREKEEALMRVAAVEHEKEALLTQIALLTKGQGA